MRRRQLPGEPPPPTKTELKRAAHAIQDLADRLIEAPEQVLSGLELPEKLADAVALARTITSRAALLRQRQFVAKLMRGVDPAPIRTALESAALAARHQAARFRRVERWRDRLAQEGPAAVAEFVAANPGADTAELARLAEAAAAERAQGSGPAGRALFRFLRAALSPDGDVSALKD